MIVTLVRTDNDNGDDDDSDEWECSRGCVGGGVKTGKETIIMTDNDYGDADDGDGAVSISQATQRSHSVMQIWQYGGHSHPRRAFLCLAFNTHQVFREAGRAVAWIVFDHWTCLGGDGVKWM